VAELERICGLWFAMGGAVEPEAVATPLEASATSPRGESDLPVAGVDPLRDRGDDPEPRPHGLADDGVAPLPTRAPSTGQPEPPPEIHQLLVYEERRRRTVPPRDAMMTRVDVMTGPMFRTRVADAWVAASVESGRAHGFSGAFAIGVLPATTRGVVDAVDVPMGAGAILRGRLRKRAMYASVGLLAGMMIHHARNTETGVVRRVDPDFRLPIRFAWTIASIGLSLALEQGFSVRDRSYARRGAVVWERKAYRVGLSIGLHWDIVHKSSKIPGGSAGRRRAGGK
jgi:hypothetical protein